METNILYLGCFAPKALVERFPTWGLDAYKVSEFLIKGFRANADVSLAVVTSPDIPSWPRSKSSIFFLCGKYYEDEDIKMVSSLNISVLKQPWTIITMFYACSKLILKNKGVKINIIIPYLVFRHVATAWLLKKIYSQRVSVTIIIPDIFLPRTRMVRCTEYMAREFDAYVLYTKAMSAYLHIDHKPQIVMESVIDASIIDTINKNSHDKIVILYTGALHERHGVMKLFEIMKRIERNDIELWITGRGPLLEKMREKSKEDSRIRFFGTIEKDKVFEFQANADILINPRTDSEDDELTKFMFPSKVMEYMLSGNPAVVCKMSGIPEEYYQYLFVPENGSIEAITKELVKVINMTSKERKEIGCKAQSFIKESKNAYVQSNRIVKLVESL